MHDFLLSSGYFCLTLTIVAYAAGLAIQKKTKLAVLNPIVLAAVMVIIVISLLDIPGAVYQKGCSVLSYLLTPATICLAISFYEQFQSLKKHLVAVFLGVFAGTVCCMGSIWLFSRLFGLDQAMLASLLPKSVTTAIGVAISEELGGIAAICTFAIILTGTLGNVTGVWLSKILRISDPISQGVAFGTASHVIGTSKAQEVCQLAGAVSSLSLTLAGLLTAAIVSVLSQFIV